MIEPTCEQDLGEAISGASGPLRVRGGGTRPIGAPVMGEVLSTAALTGVSLYEPGALTLVARAGTPLAEVEATLAAEGQRLPFEPMDHRALLGTEGTPTIGGVVAANVSGPRRIQSGACRDSLIGVRFVDGNGTILKNGGRVMKNVTGYDLVKLMAGNRGTLGVLSEVSFKVLPRTDVAHTLLMQGLSDAEAIRALSSALGTPFEVTGAAHLPRGPEGPPMTLIRIEGFEASVAYRAARLAQALDEFGIVRIEADPETNAALWKTIRDVMPFAGSDGDVWRVSVKPSDGPRLVSGVSATDIVYDWGGGLIWALMPAGTDLRAAMEGIPGHATLVRGSDADRTRLSVFHPEPAPIAAISHGLRTRFDPRGVLNPGMMG